MFQDQEFIDACSELEIPNVDGWEFFTESHDVRIYRLHNDVRMNLQRIFRSTPPIRPSNIRGGLKCLSVDTSIRTYIRTSVHPQKVLPISMKFGV